MARNADDAVNPLACGFRWVRAFFGRARNTRTQPAGPSQRTYLDLTIRREIAAADVAKARRQKKRAPFGKVHSLAHEMLKAEIGRG